jgi:arsenite methyltransferase
VSDGIEFDEKEAAETERSYLTADIVATREIVMELLAPKQDERILDIGSGPGLLLRDIADAVGPDGFAAGIDISESMTAIARHRCRDLANVELATGDAVTLPWPDAAFDRAVSTQVHEYVPDLGQAFAELRRVLKPGGRAVVMATDSASILFGPPENETFARIQDVWPRHCAHPFLPRELDGKLADAGLSVTGRKTHVILNHQFGPDHFGWHMARAMSFYAAKQGVITKDEGKAWVNRLQSLADAGGFFFSLNRYIFTARA